MFEPGASNSWQVLPERCSNRDASRRCGRRSRPARLEIPKRDNESGREMGKTDAGPVVTVAKGPGWCYAPSHEGPARAQASVPQPRAVPEPRVADGIDACVDPCCGGPTGSLRRLRGHGQPGTHKQRVAE